MNKERLIQGGINYDDGVHRFAGKPEIYEKYLMKFFAKNELPMLKQALEDKDFDAAFRAAHNIKGTAGNLSITAFSGKICQLVDALRAGVQDESLLAMYEEAETFYKAASEAAGEDTNG